MTARFILISSNDLTINYSININHALTSAAISLNRLWNQGMDESLYLEINRMERSLIHVKTITEYAPVQYALGLIPTQILVA